MAASSASRGPLSWVHSEIVVALQEVLAVLDLPDWPDAGTRIGTLAHLHQVSGALRMVELPGPQRLAEELEAALREATTALPDELERAVLRTAIATLQDDLDRRLAGHAVRDLDMLPALAALGALRQRPYTEVELFFPDLAALPAGTGQDASQAALASQLRADFQRSLLLFLRDASATAALASMAATLRQLAQLVPGRFGAARWQVLAAVLEAQSAAVGDEHEVRSFCARIDRQLRVNTHRDDSANDKLLREALLRGAHVAQPDESLRKLLEATHAQERLAPLPVGGIHAVDALQPSEELQRLARALQDAEGQLESWYRERSAMQVPAGVARAIAEATAQFDALGEDSAAQILAEAARQIAEFPNAQSLIESRLEPVAERLAGLRLMVDSLLVADGRAAGLLATLRERLLVLPEPSAGGVRPALSPPDHVARKIDEDVFGVFIEEADGLLQRLYDGARQLASCPAEANAGPLADLRAALLTLRGSGLMTGLLPLAQLAGELDQTLAGWTPDATDAWTRPLALLDDAALAMQRWLARLAADRAAALPIVPLIERARALRLESRSSLAPIITLQDIFLEEAGDRLADLRGALVTGKGPDLQFNAALRATHTLGGIALTAGHPHFSRLARTMETLLEAMREPDLPDAWGQGQAMAHLHEALARLDAQHAGLLAGRAVQPEDALVEAMRADIDALRSAQAAQFELDNPGAQTGQIHTDAEIQPEQTAQPEQATQPAQAAQPEQEALPEQEAQPAQAAQPEQEALPEQEAQPAQAAQPAQERQLEPQVLPEPAAPLEPAAQSAHPVAHAGEVQAESAGTQTADEAPMVAPATSHPADTAHPPALEEEAALANSIDADLLPVFLEECSELLPRLDQALRAWSEGRPGQHGQQALQRGLHTLKGSARMAGAFEQGRQAHQLEDLVLSCGAGETTGSGSALDRVACDRIQAGLDKLVLGIAALTSADAEQTAAESVLDEPSTPDAVVTTPLTAAAEPPENGPPVATHAPIGVEVGTEVGSNVEADADSAAQPADVAPQPVDAPAAPVESLPAIAQPEPSSVDTSSTILRLKIETLDRMANAAGEAGIARARIETETSQIKRGLSDLAENIQRLKAQLREIEIQAERALPSSLPFQLGSVDLGDTAATQTDGAAEGGDPLSEFDPLELDRYSRLQELTRTLAEGIDDVQTVHQGLRRGVDEVELALRQQGRVVRDLQQDLLRARMVPFSSLLERLQRTVRQAARESGVELALDVEGAQHEVDRTILERLVAPLEHLLRNAAAHAIESAAERSALGKPTQGQLRIRLRPGDHEVELRLSDDGRGIDLARVRAKAEVHGLLEANHATSDQELLQLIFRPGFSTAASITTLAGRGVGLDVVRSEVLGLGGRIHVDTRDQAGTDFTLVIPVTLATVQAVVVRAGDAWFAIPAPLVEQVRPVNRDALAGLHRERAAVWQGLRYPFTSLSSVLGLPASDHDAIGNLQLVFLRSADRRCALRVDELAGTQEIVVKTVSPHLARVPGVTGASVLGNGRIVLILNPVPLTVGTDGRIPDALQAHEIRPVGQTVMVVDDSITVRRVSSRLLERAGYQVQLAKDGQDALERLSSDALPAAVLLDVEMPRMDGFELIARLRARPETRDLPIIIITSRTADRHRQHAQELGVQGYLGKPYREEDLLAQLAAILRGAKPSGLPLQLADQSTSPL